MGRYGESVSVSLRRHAHTHTRGLRPVHLCPMHSLDAPFQPSASQQGGSSNSCWCACACFVCLCASTLVRARKTDIMYTSSYMTSIIVSVSPSQSDNLRFGRAQKTLIPVPPKVALGPKCLCKLFKGVAVDCRHVHPMLDVLGRASGEAMRDHRNPIP